VHCLVVEDRSEMLADPIEVQEAEEEGIIIYNHLAPKRIVGEAGHAVGIETLNVIRAFDERGRFNPQLQSGSETTWACDSVIVSIGQTGEFTWLKPEDGVEVTPRGTLAVNKDTLMTTAPGVFAGGDIAFGPRLIINAVADGQRAARGIHTYLQNLRPRLVRKGFFTPIAKREYSHIGPLRDYLRWPRRQPPTLPVERRIGVARVEVGFDKATAEEQGGRCLICSLNPIFDGELCILCNGCVDVCPMDCLKLVPVSELGGDENVAAVVEHASATSAMLLDPTRCIRCGLCAARCPTEAVVMESFRFTEEVQFVEAS
jgi:ferredoxin